jgi:hypothetical protein
LSILALAFRFIGVKIKVSFWAKDYKDFIVGAGWTPGKEKKAAYKLGIDEEADQKPSKETHWR